MSQSVFFQHCCLRRRDNFARHIPVYRNYIVDLQLFNVVMRCKNPVYFFNNRLVKNQFIFYV